MLAKLHYVPVHESIGKSYDSRYDKGLRVEKSLVVTDSHIQYFVTQ